MAEDAATVHAYNSSNNRYGSTS